MWKRENTFAHVHQEIKPMVSLIAPVTSTRPIRGRLPLLLLVLSSCLPTASLRAELKLPNIFGDHMVLQQDKPIHVWGWETAGAKISVNWAGQTKATTSNQDGQWSVHFDPVKASFSGRKLLITSGKQSLAFADILVGEVWLCGGQSNMEWTLRSTRDADLEIESADYRAIRFIRLPKIAKLEPQQDFPVENPEHPVGNWRLATSEQVENCTGVGYYFARRLHRHLKVPIGLIDTSWGGTMAQHWVSRETLTPVPEMKPYLDQFSEKLKAWRDGGGDEGAKKRYQADLKTWETKLAEARAKKERLPRKPNANAYQDPANQGQPAGMYNGLITPLAPFTLRGVVFYQGENNSFAESWKPFHRTFPAVISDWRKAFNNPQMPFAIIQIAGWSTRRSMTYDMNHHTNIIREIQFDTWQKTPGTGLIVTFDTNSNGSIHPQRKLPIGERTARWALAEVYQVQDSRSRSPLEWQGPVYESFAIEKDKVTVSFREGTHRGLRLNKDVEIGFYIAGKDRIFHHARARIIKDSQLQVWSDDVPQPVAVRYGWSNLPMGGLMNFRELPAYPFRTDKWPLTPHQSTGSYLAK
jgi:sialate O-acetylesterase